MSIRTLAFTTILLAYVVQDGRATLSVASDFLQSILNPDNLDSLVSILGSKDPDVDLDFVQLAAKYGYPANEHVIHTEDGYRLKVFRLPGKGTGLPILLFHGILDSSDTWIIRGKESLAIALADAGYDVWLGNVRGNKYSQEESSVELDLNEAYWNFTFHEHGVYDLPATIDLVLKETGASKLNAIVHSQGSTSFFVLLSTRPEYNDKVNLLIALAPVAYLHHSPAPLSILLRALPAIYHVLKVVKQYQLFTKSSPSLEIVRTACSTTTTAYLLCYLGVMSQYTGFDLTQIDPAFSLVVFNHMPTATSTKNTFHFGQVTIRETFAQFDYGFEGNMNAYNSTEPPEYKLENVNSKVVLLTARNDYFSTQADVALLKQRLPNVVKFVVNPRREMNHIDYVWGENMTDYLFPYIFDSLETYGQE